MSGAVNAVLSFLTDHYLLAGGLALGVFLLVWLIRWMKSTGDMPFRNPATVGHSTGPMTVTPVSTASDRGGFFSGKITPEVLEQERNRSRAIIKDIKEDNEYLRERISHLTNLNSILAPLIKELNANVDRRRMGPIVLRVLKRIFNPPQAMVYFLDPGGETLTLVAQTGADGTKQGFQQRVGEGFAGVVAKKKLTLCRNDLRHESNLVRQRIQEAEPGEFKTDIATPILYRGNILGVLCLGAVGDVSEDDRILFGMIADMTSLALTNYLQYRKIEELANSDPLTRLYNKGYFLEICDYELAMARKDERPMSILMLDLDHFKHYNDTNGHLAGDRTLKALAEVVKGAVREQDTVARFGGEEFVVLLHGVEGEEAMQAAERIRVAVEKYPFPHGEKQPLGKISMSIGVASMPEHGSQMEELLEKADECLYAAKKGGRNRSVSAASKVEVISF